MFDAYRGIPGENLLAALRAAHRYQHDKGPQPPYAVIRILEKKGLIHVYRRHNEWSDYHTPTRDNPNRTVRRYTIFTVILLYNALQLIQRKDD